MNKTNGTTSELFILLLRLILIPKFIYRLNVSGWGFYGWPGLGYPQGHPQGRGNIRFLILKLVVNIIAL
jgi:hypothetical protein